MWSYALIFFVVAASLGLSSRVNTNDRLRLDHGQAQAIAGSMALYRNAVITYAQANPGATGTVADTALSLPAWYTRQAGVTNYVAGGKAYVYSATTTSDLAYALAKQMGGSMNVGIKQSGLLVTPLGTPTNVPAISVPGPIPEGAVVIVQ